MKNLRIVGLLISALLLALVLPAAPSRLLAQEEMDDDSEPQRTLSVSGTGTASGQPDVAVVTLGVETEAEEASAALSQNNEQMQALIEALQEAGIAEEKIETQVVRLQPRYEQGESRDEGTPELVGYRAINLVEVRVEELGALGEILDAAIQAGGNRIENIRFEISDPSDLVDQAREAAWNEALHKAEQLAELAGAELGPVMTLSETSRVPRPVVEQAVGGRAEAEVPIQAGTQDVEIDIHVTWSLQ